MDLADLRIFKTVAEEGGIVRASRKLHRVQSNITTRVQQLEASVGTQLFVRDKQRIFLSPQGELLLAYADRLLRLAEEAKAAVSGSAPRGVFRLGALESTTASRLPAIPGAPASELPRTARRADDGHQRRTDLGGGRAPARRRVRRRSARARRALASAAVHRAAGADLGARAPPVARPSDVAGDSVIAFPNGCAYRRVLERWLGDRSLASVRMLELGSYHAIVACVSSGTGVAVVPESVLDTVHSGQVARHPLPKVHSHVVTPLIWRASNRSPALMALRKLAAGMRANAQASRSRPGAAA